MLTWHTLLLHPLRNVHLPSKWITSILHLPLPTHSRILRRSQAIHRLFWVFVRAYRALRFLLLESLIGCLILVCGRREISCLIRLISGVAIDILVLQLDTSDWLILHLHWLLLRSVDACTTIRRWLCLSLTTLLVANLRSWIVILLIHGWTFLWGYVITLSVLRWVHLLVGKSLTTRSNGRIWIPSSSWSALSYSRPCWCDIFHSYWLMIFCHTHNGVIL